MPDHFHLLARWCNSSTNGFDPFGRGAEPRWAVFLSHDCPLAASPQRIAPAKRQRCAGFVNPGDRRESGRRPGAESNAGPWRNKQRTGLLIPEVRVQLPPDPASSIYRWIAERD